MRSKPFELCRWTCNSMLGQILDSLPALGTPPPGVGVLWYARSAVQSVSTTHRKWSAKRDMRRYRPTSSSSNGGKSKPAYQIVLCVQLAAKTVSFASVCILDLLSCGRAKKNCLESCEFPTDGSCCNEKVLEQPIRALSTSNMVSDFRRIFPFKIKIQYVAICGCGLHLRRCAPRSSCLTEMAAAVFRPLAVRNRAMHWKAAELLRYTYLVVSPRRRNGIVVSKCAATFFGIACFAVRIDTRLASPKVKLFAHLP